MLLKKGEAYYILFDEYLFPSFSKNLKKNNKIIVYIQARVS
jgi:hypothetical protein